MVSHLDILEICQTISVGSQQFLSGTDTRFNLVISHLKSGGVDQGEEDFGEKFFFFFFLQKLRRRRSLVEGIAIGTVVGKMKSLPNLSHLCFDKKALLPHIK